MHCVKEAATPNFREDHNLVDALRYKGDGADKKYIAASRWIILQSKREGKRGGSLQS